MKKWILILLVSLLAVSASAGRKSFRDWLKELDARLRRTEKRYTQLTAAASVRGAKTEDSPKLYWKGRKEFRPVMGDELKAFREALSLVKEGKTEDARSGLETFLEKYPGGPLEADAKETLAYLPAPPAPPSEEPVPEPTSSPPPLEK